MNRVNVSNTTVTTTTITTVYNNQVTNNINNTTFGKFAHIQKAREQQAAQQHWS